MLTPMKIELGVVGGGGPIHLRQSWLRIEECQRRLRRSFRHGVIHQEAKTILSAYTPEGLQGEIHKSMFLVGRVHTPLSRTDRNNGQKSRKDTGDLHRTAPQFDLTDVYKTLQPPNSRNSFISGDMGQETNKAVSHEQSFVWSMLWPKWNEPINKGKHR